MAAYGGRFGGRQWGDPVAAYGKVFMAAVRARFLPPFPGCDPNRRLQTRTSGGVGGRA
jgi:hypothetical protein